MKKLQALLLLLSLAACKGRDPHPADDDTPVRVAPQALTTNRAAPGIKSMFAVEQLPFLYPPGTQTKQFSSHDPRGGNFDGSFMRSFTKYMQQSGQTNEYVFFDEYGPGCLYRQQMNIWGNGDPGAGVRAGAQIKFYFDDKATPDIAQTVEDFFSQLNVNNDLSYRNGNQYAVQYSPLPFSKRLKVVIVPPVDWTAQDWTWHQDTYLVYPQDQSVDSWTPDVVDQGKVEGQWDLVGFDPKPMGLPPNTSHFSLPPPTSGVPVPVTIFSHSGPDAIQSINLAIDPSAGASSMWNVVIEMYWDGETTPSVAVPLGKFFGAGTLDGNAGATTAGLKLTNLMYGYDGPGLTFYSYWPMPYQTFAKILLKNTGSQPVGVTSTIAISQTPYPAGSVGYFHVQETQTSRISVVPAVPFATAFQETGRGHVVGTSFYSQNYAMDGDEFVFIDGSRTPQIHGDGTEDDHNQGWGGGKIQEPLWGALINGFTGAYRLYLNDPYVFFSGININFEYSLDGDSAPSLTNPELTDILYYYYKAPGPGILELTDTLDVGDPISESNHQYSKDVTAKNVTLRSSFSGYERDRGSARFTDTGYELQSSHFTVAIDAANQGVRLRKLLDRTGNGVQVATVTVDNVQLPRPWSVVESAYVPASQGWMESDYDIPAAQTKNKTSIKVDITYVSATACVLNEYKYTAFSFMSN